MSYMSELDMIQDTPISEVSIDLMWKELETSMPFCSALLDMHDVRDKYHPYGEWMDDGVLKYGTLGSGTSEHAFNFYYLVLCVEGLIQ